MSDSEQTWLEQDKEIPGQKYVCLSFLSPEKVLANKEVFFYSRFLENYEVEYKVTASEKFLMDQILQVTKAIAKVEDLVANSGLAAPSTTDVSGSSNMLDKQSQPQAGDATVPVDAKKWRDDALKVMQDTRAALSKDAADDLAQYVKKNMRDFKETKIQEAFENFMFKNRKKLEEEFFTKNEFRTSIRGLKVRGVYDTAAEAGARAKTLQKLDPFFNVYVGQMGFWLPWDPEPADVADQEYAEDQLNTLMKKYKENESARDTFYSEQRQKGVKGMAGQNLQGTEGAQGGAQGANEGASNAAADASPFTAGVGSYASMFSGPADLAIERKKEDKKD